MRGHAHCVSGGRQLTGTNDNSASQDTAARLAALKAHLEDRAFESAGRVVAAIVATGDEAGLGAAGRQVVAFVEGLRDELADAATLMRVYQYVGRLFPRGHPFFSAFLEKLRRVLRAAVPGEEARSACDVIERALTLFEPQLGDQGGLEPVRAEIAHLRNRSNRVIRAHKEQELQALVATGNLEAALTLCREMIDTGISPLASGVLPILEEEGASPAAVAYLLAASRQSGRTGEETVEPVSWDGGALPGRRGDREQAKPSGPSDRSWRLTFQEVPDQDTQPEAPPEEPPAPRGRVSIEEAAWTAPGQGSARPPRPAEPRVPVEKETGTRRERSESPGKVAKRRPESPQPGGRKARTLPFPLSGRLVAAVAAGGVMALAWWLYPGESDQGQVLETVETETPSTATPEESAAPAEATADPDVPNPAERPQGPPGELTIEFVPPDSLELYLNGNLIPGGKIERRSVPPGRQVVVVYREGYEPLRKELWVEPNASVTEKLVLVKSPRLNLEISPSSGVEVRLDGRRIWAEFPIANMVLPVGRHRLEVSRPGYKTFSKEFDAGPGDALSFQVTLEPTAR